MKIRAYKLSCDDPSTMPSLLDRIGALPLSGRVRDTGFGEISLKEIGKRPKFYLLDFTNFRHVGPGKAPKDRPNEDFELKEDEFFGEETAGIYFPKTYDMIIEYNHHGPRASSIEQYFNALLSEFSSKTGAGFLPASLIPVMTGDQVERFGKMENVRKVDFKMFVPGALQAPQHKRK